MTIRRGTVAGLLILLAAAPIGAGIWHFGSRNSDAPAAQRATDQTLFAQWRRGVVADDLAALSRFLADRQVADVLPLADILRSDARWRRCKAQPFAMPPRAQWDNMARTLRFLRDDLVPVTGPLRVVSGYRDAVANRCFKGAKASRHLTFAALDLEPVGDIDRAALVALLCSLHKRTGARNAVGLGIYDGTRFHIDTAGFRHWGRDYRSASSPCRRLSKSAASGL
jgi:uncharacterized protein YcbK (DUF882 family)